MEVFHEGRAYFSLTFADTKMTLPQVSTFVFIGVDMFDDEPSTWYFEFVDAKKTVRNPQESAQADRKVRCLEESELSEMLSPERLLVELTAADRRRRRTLEPKKDRN